MTLFVCGMYKDTTLKMLVDKTNVYHLLNRKLPSDMYKIN